MEYGIGNPPTPAGRGEKPEAERKQHEATSNERTVPWRGME
jgi:hypothetical protein